MMVALALLLGAGVFGGSAPGRLRSLRGRRGGCRSPADGVGGLG